MAADAAGSQDTSVAVRDPAPDVNAVRLARIREVMERDPRLEYSLARGYRRGPQRASDLVVAESAELAHHERPALALGQGAKVDEQRIEPVSRSVGAFGVGAV